MAEMAGGCIGTKDTSSEATSGYDERQKKGTKFKITT